MGLETAALIGISGLALSAGSTVASFAQASKQQKLQRQAESDALKAMAEAKAKLDVNYMKNLSIKKEAYELEKESLLSQGALATQAGIESERGAASTAGKVQMAMNEAQGDIRTQMGKDLMALEKDTATEDSRLRDEKAAIDLAEAQGQQQMAADAQQAAAAATAQGWQGAISTAQQGLQMVPLYSQGRNDKSLSKLESNYNTAVASGKTLKPEFLDKTGKPLPFQQAFSKLGGNETVGYASMNPFDFQSQALTMKPKTLKGYTNFDFLVAPPPATTP